jgi:hypothetical protein
MHHVVAPPRNLHYGRRPKNSQPRRDSASAGAGCWDVETRPIGLATKKPRACALGSWLSPRCGWAVELLWRRAVRGGAGVLGVSLRG